MPDHQVTVGRREGFARAGTIWAWLRTLVADRQKISISIAFVAIWDHTKFVRLLTCHNVRWSQGDACDSENVTSICTRFSRGWSWFAGGDGRNELGCQGWACLMGAEGVE